MASSMGKNNDITGINNVPRPNPENNVSAEPTKTVKPIRMKLEYWSVSIKQK